MWDFRILCCVPFLCLEISRHLAKGSFEKKLFVPVGALILTAFEIGLEKRALAVLTELHVWRRPWFHNKSCHLAVEEMKTKT